MLARGCTTVAVALALSACAGPIETRTGSDRAAPLAATPVQLVLAGAPEAIAAPTLAAVSAALGRHGFTSAPDSPARLTVALSERPATMALLAADGRALSPAKRRRMLQNCADRSQRLLLVLETPGAAPVRAWAEETHCHGALEQSIAPLAEQAVAALVGRATPLHLRSGRD